MVDILQNKKLNDFFNIWRDVNVLNIFGFGHVCKNSLRKLKENFTIRYIIDNNKELDGSYYDEIKIMAFDYNNIEIYKDKILISTHYDEIAAQLRACGLQENIDFCSLDKFVVLWNWYMHNELHLDEVHLSVTTKCSLNCEHCNMFMPYYENPKHQELEIIKKDIDLFFDFIDSVNTFALLGGEPFLYPELKNIIIYLCEKYLNKINNIEMITNGTIIPSDEILDLIKKNGIFLRISDYSKVVQYDNKIKQLIEKLEQYKIRYICNESLNWLDFGYPHGKINNIDTLLPKHMQECAPAFKGLNDGKLYYCHVAWSAAKCGLMKEYIDDYIDLNKLSNKSNEDKLRLIKNNLGIMPRGALSLCKFCAGCSSSNKNVVPTAKQKNRLGVL